MDSRIHQKSNSSSLLTSAKLNIPSRRSIQPVRAALSIGMLIVLATLTACSASTSTASPTIAAPATSAPQSTSTSTPAPTATAMAIPTIAPAATTVPGQGLTTTQLDPCQLIDSQEASKLTGVTFTQGKASTTPDGLKSCIYNGQGANILTIEVAQAPDVATAQQDKAAFLAELQANMQQNTAEGLNVTEVPTFADGAVTANADVSAGGLSLSGNAFGFLKGTIFFGFSDLSIGGKAPSDAAMNAEATRVLGMLP